jgi:putative phage-type endonuclease
METFHDIQQGTPEWFAVRLGTPSASQFKTVMASGRGEGISLTRTKYMRQLAGERITGQPMETFSNGAMKRGKAMEAEARDYYAFISDCDPVQVGFVRNGEENNLYGCSPDALIGDDGLLEIKTANPDVLIEWIERGTLPPEHRAQVQGQMWVCERKWCDFIGYWPRMPKFIRRVERDEPYIDKMATAVTEFNTELFELVKRLRKVG